MFNQLEVGITWIESQVRFKPKGDLSRMKKAFEMLELDYSKIIKIHVAGTNGKGSVANYTAAMLKNKQYKTGLFQSPYILEFNERMSIDMKNISDEKLLNYINFIYDFNLKFSKSFGETLSFFELLTLMALKYFHDEEVEAIVMEVGIGGLLDATNILDYDVSAITNIGYDHMKQLGNTLESIALNKLGILKKGSHLITTVDKSMHPLFKDYCDKVGATYQFITDIPEPDHLDPLKYTYEGESYRVRMKGLFQIKNTILAAKLAKYVEPHLGNFIVRNTLKELRLPARFQSMPGHIYLDGAHNLSGMQELVRHLKTLDKEIFVLFSALGDKDITGMLNTLKEVTNDITLTEFDDVRFTSLRPFLQEGMRYNEDPISAFKYLKSRIDIDEVMVITGSLHFVSYMIKAIKKYQQEVFDYQNMLDEVKGYDINIEEESDNE